MKRLLKIIFVLAAFAMAAAPVFAADPLADAMAHMQAGRYGKAAAMLESLVQENPENTPALINLGVCLEAMGRTAEAESQYRKALEVDPQNPAAHNNLGHLYEEAGRYAAATDHYISALEADPANSVALQNLCSAYVRAGEFRRALNGLLELVDRGQDPPEVYSNLSLAYLKTGQQDKATETLEHGLLRHPGNELLTSNLSRLQAGASNGPQPMSVFRKDLPASGARFEMSVPALHQADKHIADGIALYQAGRFEQAVEEFTKAATLTPHRDIVYYNLGLCFLNWARNQGYNSRLLREAVFYFDKAADINPELVEAYVNKGVACRLMADHACAEKSYQDALRITDDFDAVYNLTLLYIKQGRCLKARETANQYLGNHEAEETVNILRSLMATGNMACGPDDTLIDQ